MSDYLGSVANDSIPAAVAAGQSDHRSPGVSDNATVESGVAIYIASFFDTRERLFPVRDMLTARGILVTSTWLDEETGAPVSEYASIALRDIRDIDRATMVVVDTFDVTPRGGREVELGYALGTGKKCYSVGPRRNVFHHLIPAFESWEQFVQVVLDANTRG